MAAAVAFIVAWSAFSAHRAVREAQSDIRSHLGTQAALRRSILASRKQTLERQVRFLACVPPVEGIARARREGGFDHEGRSTEQAWRQRLETIFLGFARAHPEILKVRLIGLDDDGMEIVRVDRREDSVWLVPQDRLQRKGDRGFFRRTCSLGPGSVHISDLDLNQEGGKVESPALPTLRGGTPVFGPDGRVFGIVLINIDARHLLGEFQASLPSPFRAYLFDAHGNFLSHPDASRCFGSDRGHPWGWNDEFRASPSGNGMFATRDRGERWMVRMDTLAVDSGRAWISALAFPAREFDRISNRALRDSLLQGSILSAILLLFAVLWYTGARNKMAAERAEATNRAKAEFLANMGHEIRTPMNAFLGMAHLLERRSADPQVVDVAARIRRAGTSIQRIFDGILDLSRIEAGTLSFESRSFGLSEVVDDLAVAIAAAAEGKDLELLLGTVPDGCERLEGDPRRLYQILSNIATNAVKFTESGFVRVEIEAVERGPGRATLHFTVEDSGIGIPKECIPTLFQPFTQADSSTTRRFGGTGSGLAISRRIAEAMGGSLELESREGTGSVFHLRIPFAVEDGPGQAREHAALELLVAVDSPLTRENLVRIARSLGWAAHATTDGQAAVEEAAIRSRRGEPFDAIVLDRMAAGFDALETAAELHERLGDRRPPVVLLGTAFPKEGVGTHPGLARVEAILSRPATATSLAEAVDQARKPGTGREETSSSTPRSGDRSLRGIRVLVVDDNETNREVARSVLEDEGAEVFLCEDGEHCLAWLRDESNRADVVLMDIQMPRMDGYQACRSIRSDPRLKELPIAALTAGSLEHEKEAANRCGMDDFIPKPFNPSRLASVVRRLAARDPIPSNPGETASGIGTELDLDLERALELWGSRTVLAAKLKRFADEQAGTVEEISRLAVAGDFDSAAFSAHRLKGVAAILGMDRLAASCSELESAIRSLDRSDSIGRARRSMDDALGAIRARGFAAAPGPDEPATRLPASGDPGKLADLLGKALDEGNRRKARTILEDLEPHIEPALAGVLREHLEAFDFGSAKAVLLERMDLDHPEPVRAKP